MVHPKVDLLFYCKAAFRYFKPSSPLVTHQECFSTTRVDFLYKVTTLIIKLPGALNLYKTRERIHRGLADPRLLPIPRS